MFIETVQGDLINVAHVTHITRSRDRTTGLLRATFHLSDGGQISSDASEPELDGLMPAQIIPAPPGYVILVLYRTDGQMWVERGPVLAWRMGHRGLEQPLGAEVPAANAVSTAVLCPDGRVFEAGLASYDSEEDWLKAYQVTSKRKGRRRS